MAPGSKWLRKTIKREVCGWPSRLERSSMQTLKSPVVIGILAERMIMNKELKPRGWKKTCLEGKE